MTDICDHAMCSLEELKFRSQMHDIHPLESTEATKHLTQEYRLPDGLKMLKKFTRSSGEGIVFPTRPITALLISVAYLERLWHDPELETPTETYTFIMDRLRAVCVDLSLSEDRSRVSLYIRILRLYVEMFELCLGHHFVSPFSCGFDRALHTREITKVFTSIISSGTEQLASCSAEIVSEVLSGFLLFSSFDSIRDQLVACVMTRGVSPVILPRRVRIVNLSSHLQLSEMICQYWDARNLPAAESGVTDDGSCSSSSSVQIASPWVAVELTGVRTLLKELSRGNVSFLFRVSTLKCSDTSERLLSSSSAESGISHSIADSELVSRLKRILAPLLQVWRLLLCDKVAGKSENISVFSLSKRLGIDEGAAAGLCKLLSLHLNDEPMSSMQPTVVLKSSLSEPLHLSVATQNPEIFLRKLMTVCLTILPAELHLTSEQKREMDGLTATADCKS